MKKAWRRSTARAQLREALLTSGDDAEGKRKLLTSVETALWVLRWVIKHERRKFSICMLAVLYDFCFTMLQPELLMYMINKTLAGQETATDEAASGEGGSSGLSDVTGLVLSAVGVLLMNLAYAQAGYVLRAYIPLIKNKLKVDPTTLEPSAISHALAPSHPFRHLLRST